MAKGWSNPQKQIAARACCGQKISDEHRYLMLRQLGRGEPTSTSKYLTNRDFEQFMAFCEAMTDDDQVKLSGRAGSIDTPYKPGHFAAKCADKYSRYRWKVMEAARSLGDSIDLSGFIQRMTDSRKSKVEQLNQYELHAVMEGLKAMQRRANAPETLAETEAGVPF